MCEDQVLVISSRRDCGWFILLNLIMTAESAHKSSGAPLSFVQSVPVWVSPCADRPQLPWLTLSIVLSIWSKPVWLLPVRVQVRIIWKETKWIWKTISNNIFFLLFTLDCCSVCMYVCAWCSCVRFFFFYKNVIIEIILFLKTLCKYCWWKLTFVVRQVFSCYLKRWRKQRCSWIAVVMLMMLKLIIPALLE